VKNKNLLAQKASRLAADTKQHRTGAHCPAAGFWRDQSGGVRFVAKGAIFPTTNSGPSDWTLHEAEKLSLLPQTQLTL
jgi:hypothetical protein